MNLVIKTWKNREKGFVLLIDDKLRDFQQLKYGTLKEFESLLEHSKYHISLTMVLSLTLTRFLVKPIEGFRLVFHV